MWLSVELSAPASPHLTHPEPAPGPATSAPLLASASSRCSPPQCKWPHGSASLYLFSPSALYPPVLFSLLYVFLCITNSAPNLLTEFKNSHFRPAPRVTLVQVEPPSWRPSGLPRALDGTSRVSLGCPWPHQLEPLFLECRVFLPCGLLSCFHRVHPRMAF